MKRPIRLEKPRFTGNRGQEFHADLRRRIARELSRTGRDRYATPAMWAKCAFFFVGYWVLWGVLVFLPPPPAFALPLVFLFGLFGASCALNIGHDAAHGNFSPRSWVNSTLYWVSMNMLGLYGYLWEIGHLRSHHPASNVDQADVGVDSNRVLRYSPEAPWRPVYRFQHLYGPLLYCTYTFNWVLFRDWKLLFRKELWGQRMNHSPWRFVELAFIKAFYFVYMLALPMAFSKYSWGQVLVGYCAMHVFVSIYVSLTLFMTHVSDLTEVYAPRTLGHSYVEHQFRTICDFTPTSEFANFLTGGFNAHLLHHLLPSINSVHSARLSRVLIQTADEYGLEYRRAPLWRLGWGHLVLLKRLGESARPSFRSGSLPARSASGRGSKTGT